MKVEYINPFIESVCELFSTMLNTEAKRGALSVTREGVNPRDVTALIGMSGPIRGMVSLGFPAKTALAMINHLLGTDSHVMDNSVSDGVAELVNIVAGNAKAKLPIPPGAAPIDLSLPVVVHGRSYQIDCPADAVWLQVPFDSTLGNFELRVTFQGDSL